MAEDMAVALKALLERVDTLTGRVEDALDLSELLRRGGVPNRPVSAWVIPAGLRPRSQGDAGSEVFTQAVDEHFAVVLAVQSAGDLSGGRAAQRLNQLVWDIVLAVSGADEDAAVGVWRLVAGNIVGVNAGLITYQLEFAIQLQLRTLS